MGLITALTKIIAEDYRGEHEAPDKESGAPMHDLADIYPDDIYSHEGARLYGEGRAYDNEAISIIRSAKGEPKAKIKVYRAVPKVETREEKIKELEKQLAYIQKHGKIPGYIDTTLDRSAYYEKVSDDLEELEASPTETVEKPKLNKGDWVSVSKAYAQDHGRRYLKNKYRLLSKTVKAKDLYTDGNSIHEWGYDPWKS